MRIHTQNHTPRYHGLPSPFSSPLPLHSLPPLSLSTSPPQRNLYYQGGMYYHSTEWKKMVEVLESSLQELPSALQQCRDECYGLTRLGRRMGFAQVRHIHVHNWGERERVPPWEFNAPPVCLSVCLYIYILRPSFLVPRPPRYAQT